MGFIKFNDYRIIQNNALININMVKASVDSTTVTSYFYSSSACVYPVSQQQKTDIAPLKESDAWPADPEDSYGKEKLFAEEIVLAANKDKDFNGKIARFHNIYGPLGTYEGGREKAPAALSRKIALAQDGGEIDIWGDGEQTRSFCYIDDCLEGIRRLVNSDYKTPLNIGREDMISINKLADLISGIAGKNLTYKHIQGPQGVRGRNSDNSLCKLVLGWEPTTSMEVGFEKTYSWIKKSLKKAGKKVY